MTSLIQDIKAMEEGGFSSEEISNFKKNKIFEMESAGFGENDILKEFGHVPVEKSKIKKIWESAISLGEEDKKSILERLEEEENKDPSIFTKEAWVGKELNDLGERWTRHYNMGIIDLAQNYHQLPGNDGTGLPKGFTEQPFEDTGILERLVQNLATITKDLPVYVAGGVLTNLATFGRAGTTGTAAGAGFVAGSLRETYLTALENNEVNSWSEFWDIYTKEGVKAGLTEAAQLAAAVKAGSLAKGFLTKVAAQVAGFEGVGAIIHQELPSKDQLIDSSLLFGTLGLAAKASSKVVNTIKKTNNNAIDIATDYIQDKTVVEDYASTNIKIPRKYQKPIDEIKVEEIVEDKFKDKIELDSAAENKILQKIQFDKNEKPFSTKELSNSFVKNFVDRHHPILRLLRRVQNTNNTQKQLNIYERFRTLVGMEHRAGHFIEIGTLDKNLNINGKSYKEVLKPIGKDKKTYLEFSTYKVSKRILELEKRGIDHGFDFAAAKEVVNNKKLIKKYESVSKEVDAYQLRVLEYTRDRGLITPEAFDAIVEANKNYVPFARIMELVEGKTGYGEVSNPLKAIKGSTRDIVDPMESIYSNTFHLVKLAERNAALIEFVNFVTKYKDAFPDINQKVGKARKINIERKELENILDTTSENFISDKAVENFQIFRREFLTPDSTSIGVMRNGKFEVWEVGQELAAAMKDFDPRTMGDLTKFFGAPARWLRAGAVSSPDFIFQNVLRDTVTASIFSKSGFIPIWSSLEGAITLALGKSGLGRNSKEIYQKWIRSGGMQSTLMSLDRNIKDKPAFKILNEGPIRNKLVTPLEMLRIASEISENMTRLSEFKRTYKKSKKLGLTEKESIERGGFESRDVTIDYSKMGMKMKAINQLAAFTNARIQGYTKLVDAFKQRPGRALTAITASIILPSIYLWFVNKDDPIYQRQEEWVKNNYWIIIHNGVAYKIAKPFEPGVVFGTGTEQLLDWLNTEHPDELSDFIKDFAITQLKAPLSAIPTIAMPFIEAAFNYSIYKGQPLVPHEMDDKLLSKYQYTIYTSEVAKGISRAINTLIQPVAGDYSKLDNPVFIDNFLKSWFASLGRFTIQMADKGLVEFGVIEDPIKPTDSLTVIPGIRAFQVRDPSGGSEFITDFYKEFTKINKDVSSVIALEQRGENVEAQKLKEKIGLKDKNMLLLLNINDAIKEMNLTIRNIHNTKQYTADEKRELIDDMYLLMIKTAKRGLVFMNLNIDKTNEK
jgi:hypothetical protein